jgi:hypothetical protein
MWISRIQAYRATNIFCYLHWRVIYIGDFIEMTNNISHSMLGLSGAMLLAASSSSLAFSTEEIIQMKACKSAVAGNNKFMDVPMAGISVRPGNKENHVRFTVQWEGLKGHGNCKVNKKGHVKEVNVKEFHDGRGNNKHGGGSGVPKDIDGFYYDRHMGQWRDPDGEVCHTCTPENGFPARQHNW